MRRRPDASLALTVGLLLITLSSHRLSGAPAAAQSVKIKAFEFAYEPKEVTVRAGEVTFDVQNTGAIEHNFLVEDAGKKLVGKVAVIPPGQAEQVKVTLRPGAHTIYCDLPGHRDAGMVAALRVQP